MSTFHIRLFEQRKALGLKQADMAKALGIPFRSYRRYESGESEPTVTTLCVMADYFQVSLDDLVGREGAKEEL